MAPSSLSLAACLAYVDLNPIRAGIANSPETSRFTSVYERLKALDESAGDLAEKPVEASVDETGEASAEPTTLTAEACDSANDPVSPNGIAKGEEAPPTAGGSAAKANRRPARADWLSPFTLEEETAGRAVPSGRASNRGCLPMSFADYLELLDWTGRQLRSGTRGVIPADLPPILERLQVSGAAWLDLMTGFSRLFRRAAGRPDSLRRHAAKWGQQRPSGLARSQALFG